MRTIMITGLSSEPQSNGSHFLYQQSRSPIFVQSQSQTTTECTMCPSVIILGKGLSDFSTRLQFTTKVRFLGISGGGGGDGEQSTQNPFAVSPRRGTVVWERGEQQKYYVNTRTIAVWTHKQEKDRSLSSSRKTHALECCVKSKSKNPNSFS